MLKDITEVQPLENFHLRLRYENGVEGVVDIAGLILFTGVFAPLKDPAYLSQVRIIPIWAPFAGLTMLISTRMCSTPELPVNRSG